MKISISYKITFLVVLPAIGAVLSLLVFFSHMGHMDAQGFVIDIAGRQRMLAQTMLRYADMVVLLHQEEDRQPILGFIDEFESCLSLLDKGGESNGYSMYPASDDVAAEIAEVKQIWSQVRTALETIVEIPTGDPRVADAHRKVRDLIPWLTDGSDKVVKLFYQAGSAARQRTEMAMLAVAGLNFFLLGVAFLFSRRYISRPISQVERGVRRVGKGDYSYRVPIISHDEIASLSVTFNEMSAKIKTSLEEVAKLGSAVHNMSDSLFITDPNGVIEYVNPAFEQITGYSREEAIGQTPQLLKSVKTDPEKYRELWQTIQSGNTYKWHVINQKKSGELFHYRETISPLKDENGQIINFISTGEDVTDLVNASKELEESEKRFRGIYENATIGLYRTTPDGRVLMANPAHIRQMGYETFEEFCAVHPGEHYPEENSREDFVRLIEAEGSVREHESIWKKRDGLMIYVRESARAVRGEDGKTLYYEGTVEDITARVRAEEALRESEIRYKAVFERAGDYVLLLEFGIDGIPIIVDANEAALVFHGYSRDELIGQPITLIGTEMTPAMLSERKQQIEEKGEAVVLVHHVRKDGSRFDAEATIQVMKIGPKVLLLSIERDVTERQKAALALQMVEIQYREAVESVSDGFYTTDLEGRFQIANPATMQITGYSQEELWQMRYSYLVLPEHRERVKRHYLRQFARKAPNSYIEFPMRRKSGEIVWIGQVSTLRIENQRQIGFHLVARDITDRMRAEEALRDSEEKYRAILNNAQDGIFVRPAKIGQLNKFTEVNVAACRMLGYTREELLTLTPADIVNDSSREYVVERSDRSQTGTLSQYETTLRSKQGSDIPVEINTHTFTYKGETMIVSLVRDIAARKQLEIQFHQSQKMETIGQLAGGIAHDFNNLLTVISGHSDLLRMSLSPNDPIILDIEAIQKAADRATGLTRQLLAFSRKQTLSPKVLDLNTVIKDLEKMLKRLIREDISLAIKSEPDLWKVLVDPTQMEQILVNLTVNARDAMPDGGKLDIETSNVELDDDYLQKHPFATSGRFVIMAVSDTGFGMSPEIMSKIFEPFFTTKEVGKGTGLGLSTVFGIVKQSGGSIDVYSEPGKGTSFKVYLPIAPNQAEEAALSVQKSEGMQHGHETILVVEDEEGVRNVAVGVLEHLGYKVISASNGGEAFLLCQKMTKQIDLLLTDMIMPNMGGDELAKLLRGKWPSLRVLLMSGYSADFVTSGGMLESGSYYLPKPFRAPSLAYKVREVLDA